jgi:putative flippase GtrA
MKRFLLKICDTLHKPFSSVVSLTLFRYGFFGGLNLALDIFLYFIAFHFILHKQMLHVGSIAISAHIAAFLIAFSITFPIGFFAMRHLVFNATNSKARLQLAKYFGVVCLNVVLNYTFLKLFVEEFGIFPTPSKIITAVIVVTLTYIIQSRFTFKTLK